MLSLLLADTCRAEVDPVWKVGKLLISLHPGMVLVFFLMIMVCVLSLIFIHHLARLEKVW